MDEKLATHKEEGHIVDSPHKEKEASVVPKTVSDS